MRGAGQDAWSAKEAISVRAIRCSASIGEQRTPPNPGRAPASIRQSGAGRAPPSLVFALPCVFSQQALDEEAKGGEPHSVDSLLLGSTSWRQGTLHRSGSR